MADKLIACRPFCLGWRKLFKSDYSGVSFMGDASELLVIWTTPKDNVGIFNASFQWSSKDTYAFTSLGKCNFER